MQKVRSYKYDDIKKTLGEKTVLSSYLDLIHSRFDPTHFSLATGGNAVPDEVWPYQTVNDFKNQWYAAAAPADMQNGMPFVSNVNGALYLKALGLMTPIGTTIPQSDKTANYVILTTDLNSALTMNNAAARTFTLCSIDASHIGKFVLIGKWGAGKVTINRADADTIGMGTQVGKTSIYNNFADELDSWILLRITAATRWSAIWATNPMAWILA